MKCPNCGLENMVMEDVNAKGDACHRCIRCDMIFPKKYFINGEYCHPYTMMQRAINPVSFLSTLNDMVESGEYSPLAVMQFIKDHGVKAQNNAVWLNEQYMTKVHNATVVG